MDPPKTIFKSQHDWQFIFEVCVSICTADILALLTKDRNLYEFFCFGFFWVKYQGVFKGDISICEQACQGDDGAGPGEV